MAIPYRNERLVKPREYSLKLERWYGLNCADERISDGEFVRMKNISCNGQHVYPRAPRSVVAEGIDNPSKVLFCGGKLSYIAKGKLHIQNGSVFEDKGDVGLVTSYTEFSDKETLFFPGNTVYNNETDSVSAITAYLSKQKGYYNQTNEYVADPTPTNVSTYNGVYMQVDGRSDTYIKVSPIAIAGSDESNYIYPPALKDANGKDITENGKKKYGSVSINVSGTCISDGGLTDHTSANSSICLGVFVHAWDEDGKLLTEQSGNTTYFKDFKIGDTISFDGKAAKLLVQLGYFKVIKKKVGTCFECDSECLAKRDADFNNNNFKVWISESTYPAPNSRPDIAYACTDNNRVVGVSKNSFYASSLGDYSEWIDFVDASGNPKSTGAYAEELKTNGDFTGAVKYRTVVILTKKNTMYECYGGKPPYRIRLQANSGCVDNRTITEINGILYWLGPDAVYRFSGSLPVNISRKINPAFGKFLSGCAASDGRRYYVYAKGENAGALMVYDTVTGLWCMEDDTEFVDMTSYDNTVYAITADGTLYKFSDGGEQVEWELETKAFNFGIPGKKKFKNMSLRVKMQQQCTMDIYIKYDDGEYKRHASFSSVGTDVADIRLKPEKCDSFSLVLKGRGNAKIIGLYGTVICSSKRHDNSAGLITY